MSEEELRLCRIAHGVAIHNNEAVALMEKGDYVTASAILRSMIDILQANHDSMEMFTPEDGFLFELEVSADSLTSLSKSLPTTTAAREQAPLGMFDHAFFLNQADLAEHGCFFGIRQFSLILLFFNMGLCMHIQAYAAHARQDDFFGQAVILYQMACGLFESSGDERMLLLLHLSLSNNLASVHAQYCDILETQRWLDEVRFLYVLNLKTLSKDEATLFSTNLLANERLTTRSPPAA